MARNPSALRVAREVQHAARWSAGKAKTFTTISKRAADWINRHPEDFRRLVASTRAKNPKKRKRKTTFTFEQLRKIGRRAKPGTVAHAVGQHARAYFRRRKNPRYWYIHAQRAHGPVLLYNGRSFSSRENNPPKPFTSADAAMYKARHLLGEYHHILRFYKIWVSDQYKGAPTEDTRVNPKRRKNPEKLDQAAKKLEDFTGHPATHVERARTRSDEKTGLVMGELKAVEYLAARKGIEGGRMVRWHHKFRKGSRPLLAVSTDGKQLHVVGGQYEFTAAGIEDR
jgi:hypothetical protein